MSDLDRILLISGGLLIGAGMLRVSYMLGQVTALVRILCNRLDDQVGDEAEGVER